MKYSIIALTCLYFLIGCSKETEQQPIFHEVFPGVYLRLDPNFNIAHKNQASFYFDVFLENRTEKGVYLNKWESRFVVTNLGNGTSSRTAVSAEKAYIEAGNSHPLQGYLYIGPRPNHKFPNKYISGAVGENENKLSFTSLEKEKGDCLIGISTKLQVGDDRSEELFLVKYYFDESENMISPYYVLGQQSANQTGDDNSE